MKYHYAQERFPDFCLCVIRKPLFGCCYWKFDSAAHFTLLSRRKLRSSSQFLGLGYSDSIHLPEVFWVILGCGKSYPTIIGDVLVLHSTNDLRKAFDTFYKHAFVLPLMTC